MGSPPVPQRRSLRLPGFNYAEAGAYFVTICSGDRRRLFGQIIGREMRLNGLGSIVRDEWLRTPSVRSNVTLDAFVVMPNHLHGIILIGANSAEGGTDNRTSGRMQDAPTIDRSLLKAPSQTIGAIVRGFKAATTSRIRAATHEPRIIVWQRNYFEHVIRDDDDLDRIRDYIATNPERWPEDSENPERNRLAVRGIRVCPVGESQGHQPPACGGRRDARP